MKNKIFIVDDDQAVGRSLVSLLGNEGFDARSFTSLSSFRHAVATNANALLLLDIALPDEDGLTALPKVKLEFPGLEVIMITGEATIQRAVIATKSGAYDFLEKPIDPARLLLTVRNLFASLKLKSELRQSRGQDEERYRIIGESAVIRQLLDKIALVAASDSTVLITGENGTGKELVAHQIKAQSSRREQAFVKLNCAALPHELAESELFGYRKGAFTGADRNRDGKFKTADGGTIFLDEIAELSPAIQAKLLRILETGELEPLGADMAETVDVRVITATNRNLEQLVNDGKFRVDLFYRLNIVPIAVAPLRERREDIPILVNHFARRLSLSTGLGEKCFATDAIGYFAGRQWRGNVRELRNIVERCFIMSRSTSIDLDEVKSLLEVDTSDQTAEGGIANKLTQTIGSFEKAFLKTELGKHNGNISDLARSLGIDRGNLSKKLKSYGIV